MSNPYYEEALKETKSEIRTFGEIPDSWGQSPGDTPFGAREFEEYTIGENLWFFALTVLIS